MQRQRDKSVRGLDRASNLLLVVFVAMSAESVVLAEQKTENSGERPAANLVGRVVHVDGSDVYLDVGKRNGASEGVEVTLLRVVSAVHPVTGERLEDRFGLVTVPILEAGEVLSLVRVPEEVAGLVPVGAEVRLPSALTLVEETTKEADVDVVASRVVEAQATAPSPELEAFKRAFSAASGGGREARLSAWRWFLHVHPESELASIVKREVAFLFSQEEPAGTAVSSKPKQGMAVVGPERVMEGAPLRVVATATGGEAPSLLMLHFRRAGEESFRFRRMEPYGDDAFAGEIEPEMLETVGIEWYVTAAGQDGAEYRVGPLEPSRTHVEPRPMAPSRLDRSRVSLAIQYVDFYRFRHLDSYMEAQADFLYRAHLPLFGQGSTWPQIYSVRMGFGAYHGVGGTADAVVSAAESGSRAALREVGFNFGYSELELRVSESLALLGRGIVGIGEEGLGLGAQGSVRIGPELGTNLVLGALGIGDIGQSWLIQLSWDTVPNVPMNASVEVTTWPVGSSDLGVRLLYEARYRLTPWMELGGRLGYGLRNINHGGMTLGIGTVFSW